MDFSIAQKWNSQVAVITGANIGIGHAISKKMIKLGIKVVGLDIETENMQKLSEQCIGISRIFYYQKCDITNEIEVIKAFNWISEEIGHISILINNAGVVNTTNLIDGNVDQWKKTLDTNILGLCICTKEAVQRMLKNNVDGHIIHMNSICGHTVPKINNFNVYPASKHAVTALTETLRRELINIKSNIKISSVSPGLVKTDMVTKKMNTDPEYKNSKVPLLNCEDVVNAVLYILSTPQHVQVHELILKPLHEDV